jgi:hypothetical protein
MKRNIIGAILFCVLVGEVTVGYASGLFTLPGIVVFLLMYLLYFILLDAIAVKYQLSNMGLVLVNFALYSVLITGLFHGEIADYVLRPANNLMTTLIRVQCSFYPLFALYLLRKYVPNRQKATSVRKAAVLFALFFAVISPSKSIGFIKLHDTFQIAPGVSLLFTFLAVAALLAGLRMKSSGIYVNRRFEIWTWVLLAISLIPGLVFFILLLMLMLIVGVFYLARKDFRNSSVLSTSST